MTDAPPTFSEADFRKSSRSEPDKECVMVARRAGWVVVRDSKTVFGSTDDRHLALRAPVAKTFLDSLHAGQLITA